MVFKKNNSPVFIATVINDMDFGNITVEAKEKVMITKTNFNAYYFYFDEDFELVKGKKDDENYYFTLKENGMKLIDGVMLKNYRKN